MGEFSFKIRDPHSSVPQRSIQPHAAAPRRDQAAEEMDGQWTPHVDGVVCSVKTKENGGEID